MIYTCQNFIKSTFLKNVNSDDEENLKDTQADSNTALLPSSKCFDFMFYLGWTLYNLFDFKLLFFELDWVCRTHIGGYLILDLFLLYWF